MFIDIFKAIWRDRNVKTLMLNIILFSAILTPFYTIPVYYNIIGNNLYRYVTPSDVYIILNSTGINTSTSSYISIKDTIIYTDNLSIEVYSYSFSNITLVNKLIKLGVDRLDKNECALSRYIANKLGISVGDYINIKIDGRPYKYKVVSINSYLPLIIPYNSSKNNIGIILRSNRICIGGNVYRLGSPWSMVNELKIQIINLIKIWSLPLYILVIIGIAIITSRFQYSFRKNAKMLYEEGLSKKKISLYIILALTPIIFLSSLVGISLGLIVSQASSKILYAFSEGITIIPQFSLEQYIILLLVISLSSLIGAISIVLWGKLGYED